MSRRLRPARRRRRALLRVSLPVVVLPLLGLLVLIQATSLRGPLSEAEAPLALAVRYPKRGFVDAGSSPTSAAATAVASMGSKVLGTSEFHLRSVGIVAGCVALGSLVWLGERLFSTWAGVVAALALMATPAGRSLLGTDLGVEPFSLMLMLMALGAIRNLSADRRSLVRSGLASGTAIALVGPSATWIPLLAVAWLRKLHGLTWRSFAIAVGTPALAAVVVALLSAVVVGMTPLPPISAFPPAVPAALAFAADAVQLAPFLPFVVLGLWNAPKHWGPRDSPRFLLLWTLLAASVLFAFGEFAPLWTALAMTVGLVTSWAVLRARRTHVALALLLSMSLSVWLGSFEPTNGEFDVDRWAVRETGKFVRRNLDERSTIGAPPTARRRLAYYATRSIEEVDGAADRLDGLDYVVLDRRTLDGASPAPPGGARPPRELTLHGRRLQVIAEFGSWVLARVDRA